MARSIDEILAEVSKRSDPDRQTVLKQISDIPALQQADEAGLEAQRNKGFEDINLGARRRGVAYWGAPIAEQQNYLSTEYLPAAAKMKQGYNDRRSTLESALSDIGKQDYSTAYNIFNTDRQFEEQQRQFNEQMAESRRAAAQQSADISKYFQQNNAPTDANKTGGVSLAPALQKLYNQVFVKSNGSAWSDRDLVNDYNATFKSAKYGNARDKQKLELYHSIRPDLFGTSIPAVALANGGKLQF